MTSPLSERTRRILAALIREYIETGEPVASAALTRRAGLGVSSATIRNVLAQLEEMGYVLQPHTSSGRVPTDVGYRFYVDLLLEARRASERRVGGGSACAATGRRRSGHGRSVVHRIARALGGLAARGLCGVSGRWPGDLPSHRVRAISDTRILIVVVTRGNHVSQKVGRHRRDRELNGTHTGGQLSQFGVLRPAARPGARKRARAASRRAVACTINCWDWRCGSRAGRSKTSNGPARCASTGRRRCSMAS